MTNGVYPAKKKDGTKYYRASVTVKGKHISLGSFQTEKAAGAAYALAGEIINGPKEYMPEDYDRAVISKRKRKTINSADNDQNGKVLGFDKWIVLLNLRKTGMYFKNPIFLYGKYFVYFLDKNTELKFDADELFFYGSHRIQKRGGRLFYSDYGMQCGLLGRYGVRSFSVKDRDYGFKNGDETDFRYGNLVVYNKYYGVFAVETGGRKKYEVRIHLVGDIKVGTYQDETEAAIAYNKAADSLEEAVRRRKNTENENAKSTAVENKMLGKTGLNGTNYAISGGKNSESNNNWANNVIYNSRMDDSETQADRELSENTKNHLKQAKNDTETRKNIQKYRKWTRNYMENVSKRQYIEIYESLKFSKSFKNYLLEM
ncbi:MAG: hypothetical protein K5795_07350 [Lachnospiraceae bacterium]|nr:hypothetical protein [Lachnospiraceae bacterium]